MTDGDMVEGIKLGGTDGSVVGIVEGSSEGPTV